MATRFREERGPGMSAVHLLSDDGGHCLVYCAIPGGRPRFMLRPDSQHDCAVDGAPAMESHRDFVKFVKMRWADDWDGDK